MQNGNRTLPYTSSLPSPYPSIYPGEGSGDVNYQAGYVQHSGMNKMNTPVRGKRSTDASAMTGVMTNPLLASRAYTPSHENGAAPYVPVGFTPARQSQAWYHGSSEYGLHAHTRNGLEGEYDDEEEDDDDDDDNEDYEHEDDSDEEEALLKPKPVRKPPIMHRWNYIPCFLFVWFMVASGYYYYVRYTMLKNSYAVFVFSIEVIGWTSFTPYAILIMRGVYSTGSPGLPPAGSPEADEQEAWWSSPSKLTPARSRRGSAKKLSSKNASPMSMFGGSAAYSNALSPATSIPETSYFTYRFHVRVLVPCYKEDLAVIASTVQAALSADLPAMTRRTVYLLDDGKVGNTYMMPPTHSEQ
jgi:hypothetical protein